MLNQGIKYQPPVHSGEHQCQNKMLISFTTHSKMFLSLT